MSARFPKALPFLLTGVLLLLAVTLLAPGPGVAGSGQPLRPVEEMLQQEGGRAPGRVWLVLVPGLTWSDIEAGGSTWRQFAEQGAIGVMTVNSADGGRPAGAAASLGSGARLRGSAQALSAGAVRGDAGQDLRRLYEQRTGRPAPSEGIVVPGWPMLERLNRDLSYDFRLGALGESLHEAGMAAAVYGSSDLPGPPWQSQSLGALVAMDRRGRIDAGRIGREFLREDPAWPGGWRTNEEKLLAALESVPGETGLVVVEWGDLLRLADQAPLLSPEREALLRAELVARSGSFIAKLMGGPVSGGDLLLVASPSLPPEIGLGGGLAPILALGEAVPPGSRLISPTTRRAGLMANLDVAPTILAFLGLRDAVGFGRPAETLAGLPQKSAFEQVGSFYHRAVGNDAARPGLIKGFIYLGLGVLLFGALYFLWKPRKPLWVTELLSFLLLTVTSVPLALLLLPLVRAGGLWRTYGIAAGLSLGIALGAYLALRRRLPAPFVGVAVVTTAVIAIDLLSGARLMLTSPLGYSPLSGARYYGIGNELMGVLLGAGLVGLTGTLDFLPGGVALKWRRAVPWVLGGFLFLLGAPHVGANFGGSVAGSLAFLATSARLILPAGPARNPGRAGVFGRTGSGQGRAAFVGALAVTVILGFVLLDRSGWLGPASHVARAVEGVQQGGVEALWQIVSRKWSMNLKLIRYTSWTYLLIGSLGVYALLVYRPAGILRRLARKHPSLFIGLEGVAVASLVALVSNDSGVVAAATAVIYASAPLVSLVAAYEGMAEAGSP